MMECTHHWTVTSECPRCLRERLVEADAQFLDLKSHSMGLADRLAEAERLLKLSWLYFRTVPQVMPPIGAEVGDFLGPLLRQPIGERAADSAPVATVCERCGRSHYNAQGDCPWIGCSETVSAAEGKA